MSGWNTWSSVSSERQGNGHRHSDGGSRGSRSSSSRHEHSSVNVRQDQMMFERQELEQVQRTQRFLEQIEKATRNVREYVDAVATGADAETMETTNLIAGMSMRAMNMSSKALRKDGLDDALRLGRKKILQFYRENNGAYAGAASAEDLFEQYATYMRNVVEGKQVPRLPVAIPEETTDAEAGRQLNDTVGALLSGYHGVDEADQRTASNFASVKEQHATMLREARAAEGEEKVEWRGVELDANKFNEHVGGVKVVFDREHMARAERAMKQQRYQESELRLEDEAVGANGEPMLGFEDDGDVVMGGARSRVAPRGGRRR